MSYGRCPASARPRRAMTALLLLGAVAGACAHAAPAPTTAMASPRIVERPIPFSQARVEMTRAYLRDHYGIVGDGIEIVPRVVVLHWTAAPTLEGSFGAFAPERLPGSRTDLAGSGELNVSAHFLVDRDGTIYRLMPETWMARHVIGLNHVAIGIENVGGAGGAQDLTPAQVDANVRLVRDLVSRHPTLQYLIGHSEYRLFESHPLWRERDEGYRTSKIDPGPRFMSAVRLGVAPLGLKGPGEITREGARPR